MPMPESPFSPATSLVLGPLVAALLVGLLAALPEGPTAASSWMAPGSSGSPESLPAPGPGRRVTFGSLFAPLHFRGSRHRANYRACLANQKTLAGAVEMLELDTNCNLLRDGGEALVRQLSALPDEPFPGSVSLPRSEPRLGRPGHPLWMEARHLREFLLSRGYLQYWPRDPGAGHEEQARNYIFLEAVVSGVFCLRHGSLGHRDMGTARSQLRSLGIQDPELLARASDRYQRGQVIREEPMTHLGELEILFLLALAFLFGPLGRWSPSRHSWMVLGTGFLVTLGLGAGLLDVPRAARVFRGCLLASWTLGGLLAVGSLLGVLRSGASTAWIHPAWIQNSLRHPMRAWAPESRAGAAARLRADVRYLGTLGLLSLSQVVPGTLLLFHQGSSGGPALPGLLEVVTPATLFLMGSLTGAGLFFSVVGSCVDRAYSDRGARHLGRGLLLALGIGAILVAGLGAPTGALASLGLAGCFLAPRYLVAARLLEAYAEDLEELWGR